MILDVHSTCTDMSHAGMAGICQRCLSTLAQSTPYRLARPCPDPTDLHRLFRQLDELFDHVGENAVLVAEAADAHRTPGGAAAATVDGTGKQADHPRPPAPSAVRGRRIGGMDRAGKGRDSGVGLFQSRSRCRLEEDSDPAGAGGSRAHLEGGKKFPRAESM